MVRNIAKDIDPGQPSVERVALVTGASSGIGAATVRSLRERGYLVYGAARRVSRLTALEAEGMRALAIDVTDDAAMSGGVERVLQETGRIDVLVNNAGFGAYGALEDVPMEDGRRQFDVNLFGPARLIQLVLPTMRAQKSGTIVNVSSIGGKIYGPLGSWYHATKFALEGLSDALRLELAPFGIRVVIVEPGAIRTEWNTIARENLIETSGDTAYAAIAHRVRDVLARADAAEHGSDPRVVAEAIGTAVTARIPRARYAVGSGARSAVLGRRLLSDATLDRIIGRNMGTRD